MPKLVIKIQSNIVDFRRDLRFLRLGFLFVSVVAYERPSQPSVGFLCSAAPPRALPSHGLHADPGSAML